MPPVKIAHVVGNLETGGMQMLVMQLMRHLDRSRYTPYLYSMRNPNHFEAEIQEKGWNFEQIVISRRLRQPQIAKLAAAFQRDGIEIVHPHAEFANIAGRAAGLVAGVPGIIAHFQNTYEHRLTPRMVEVERHLAQFTDAIICCGVGVTDHYRETYSPRPDLALHTVPNAFDLSPFRAASKRRAELRKKLGFRDDEFIILHTARFEPHKQPELLLDAMKVAEPHMKNWRLVFLGKGSIYEETVEHARQLFPEERVQFAGWSREVPEHLAAADLFVLCSRNEGLPLSVVEALAAGTPVIASDIIGPNEVIGGQECGILFPTGDIAAMAEGIVLMQSNKELWQRYASSGKMRAEEYGIECLLARTEKVYESVIATTRPPRAPMGWFGTRTLLGKLRQN